VQPRGILPRERQRVCLLFGERRKVRVVDVDRQQLEAVVARRLEDRGRSDVRVHVRVELPHAREVGAPVMRFRRCRRGGAGGAAAEQAQAQHRGERPAEAGDGPDTDAGEWRLEPVHHRPLRTWP
jgi:hypothetical protein